MQAVLTVSGWLLLLQGVAGLGDALWNWWGWAHGLLVVNVVPALKGYEVFGSIVIGVLGFVLLSVAGSLRREGEA
ncbi:hypothetical protein ABZW11_31490 [Nonomuraea sp. NPDC004580]|uniref:hypothetical protein n=1 Tax=Nonomuraea sp. NPDC004580 TaxID=3154552 RepID=UPI0033B05654